MELFDGNKKINTSILSKAERRLIDATAPNVPRFLNGVNLTLLSLFWSALTIYFSYLAVADIRWLWGASAMMVLHWITDALDGAVGRYRGSGLVRWGFYMDHLVDLVFASSAFLGYSFLVGAASQLILFVFFIAFTVLTGSLFLSFPAYKGFIIGQFGVGPTESRILIILLNTGIIYLGVPWFEQALPFFALLLFIYAFMLVYRTQRDMYRMDMRSKK